MSRELKQGDPVEVRTTRSGLYKWEEFIFHSQNNHGCINVIALGYEPDFKAGERYLIATIDKDDWRIPKQVPDWFKPGNYAYHEKDGFFKIDNDDMYFESYKQAELIPYSNDDDLLGMKVKYKNNDEKYLIIVQNKGSIRVSTTEITYKFLLVNFEQLNDKPCGKLIVKGEAS